MANQRTFEKQLDRFLVKANMELITFQKKVSFEILRRVVQKTPVDTGWAQNSWQISIGDPDLRVPQKPTEGVRTGVDILSKLGSVSFNDPFTTVYITNNLHYIRYLEEGWSRRAPNGMVAVTIKEVTTAVRAGVL